LNLGFLYLVIWVSLKIALRTLRNRSISMSLPVMAPLHTGHTGAATPPHLGCMVVSMSLDRQGEGWDYGWYC